LHNVVGIVTNTESLISRERGQGRSEPLLRESEKEGSMAKEARKRVGLNMRAEL
jgi:hypothetical protein